MAWNTSTFFIVKQQQNYEKQTMPGYIKSQATIFLFVFVIMVSNKVQDTSSPEAIKTVLKMPKKTYHLGDYVGKKMLHMVLLASNWCLENTGFS